MFSKLSTVAPRTFRFSMMPRLKMPSRFCTTTSKAAKDTKPETFLQQAQVDSGFYQGAALLVGALAFGQFAPTSVQSGILVNVTKSFRSMGLKPEYVSDKDLLEDFIKKNILAAQNVVLASPSFYFMWHLMHGSSLSVTCARAFTGTIRIVPFMGIFYGGFAVVAPWITQVFMQKGQTYKEAQGNAGTALMLSGFAALEAVVELRGCGVPFSSMSISAFAIFIPALIGRLVAGVLTQQQKVGSESTSILPIEWKDGDDETKRKVYAMFETLAIDTDFMTTVVGTSVFQHLLNGVTFVLLNKGKANVLRDFLKYLGGGMTGTFAGSLNLFARTVALRTLFCWTWNFCSSQPRSVDAIPMALKELENAVEV